MTNLLLNPLPDGVEVGGIWYKIHTDFRVWMKVEQLLFWSELPWGERIAHILHLCYADGLPRDLGGGFSAVMRFFSADGAAKKEPVIEEKQTKPAGSGWKNRYYSFDHDAELLYAAFYGQYGINLTRAQLHWWEFRALFAGLDESTKLSKVMGIRAMDVSKIKDREQKAYYRRLKRLYRLPDLRTEEEKEADLVAELGRLF